MVAGANGCNMIFAVDDTRWSFVYNDFAAEVFESSYVIDDSTATCIDSAQVSALDDEMFRDDSVAVDTKYFRNIEVVSPVVGDHVEIFSPLDNRFYPRTV